MGGVDCVVGRWGGQTSEALGLWSGGEGIRQCA